MHTEWNRIVQGDCLRELPRLPTGCADLVFADPPFNIGYEYDVYNDRRSRQDYLDWAERWLREIVRLLKPTGCFWLAIGDEYVAEYKVRIDQLGLHLRNWVVWHYTFGVACTRKFNRSHAHLLYYVCDPERLTFNADAVRVPSARMTTYADRRANPRGKLPDDVWVLRPQESPEHYRADMDVWYVPRVCGTFRERTEHPCQMPLAVLERIILATSNPGDLVIDPFAGSGTTLVAAKRHGRRFWGCELSPRYAATIEQRLQAVEWGVTPHEPAVSQAAAPRRARSQRAVPTR